MPQAGRKDVAAQRAQDKESKRARGAMSCAECRRLKLKCDKTVPCSSCKRRGCSEICPNGSLVTGQGTRFVLADTDKLHSKIAQMSDRIRQLEDALAIMYSTVSTDPHPLLHRDLLKIKSSIELHSAAEGKEGAGSAEEVEESQYIDAFGTLAIRDDGAATFYGRSAGSESLLIGESRNQHESKSESSMQGQQSPLQQSHPKYQPLSNQSISQLSGSFPFPSNDYHGIDLETLAASFLPPAQDGWRLCEQYLDQAPWFFGAVTRRQLHEELLPLWYPKAHSSPNQQQQQYLDDTKPPPTRGGAHELALIFVIFCFGALTDVSLPPPPDNPESDRYFQLTRAALSLEPVLDRPPSVATVQTLSLMAIYQGLSGGDNSIESTWALMGLATKLAQSIGLHRDCARWKLTTVEVQKRRALFWELFITDCWQSLATGRLATFSLPFVDCELPADPDETIAEDGSIQPSFPAWKARFGFECVAGVVQDTLTSRAPKYSKIVELDRKIRDMELPKYAQGETPQGVGLAETMSHFMPHNYRELTLLYVHRCFFAHAISSHPNDPIKSPYAPSFLAGYRSACELVNSVRTQFSLFPAQIARFWVLWTHAFSASVMLSSVVTHSPSCKVAPAALLELRMACELFEKAATHGGRATKFLPILQRLLKKAHETFVSTRGRLTSSPSDIFTPTKHEEKMDELEIFSGKTHTVSTKANPSTSRQPKASSSSLPDTSPQIASQQSTRSSESPKSTLPNFVGVHPSLVDQLHGFDGHLTAQIQNAYYNNHDEFARTLLENQQFQAPAAPTPMRPSPPAAYQPSASPMYTSRPMYNLYNNAPGHTPQASHSSQQYEQHPSGYGSRRPSYAHAHSESPPQTHLQQHGYPQTHPKQPQAHPQPHIHSHPQSRGYPHSNPHPHPHSQSHPYSNSQSHSYPSHPSTSSQSHPQSHPQQQYWNPSPEVGYPNPGMDQYAPHQAYSSGHQAYHMSQNQQQPHNSPDSMSGTGDGEIQEAWTSFMYKVGSPAAFMNE